ncbi:T. brucei spp.-specific protein [Trypanosoma brucei gambiense DAL972]|uniref:T. brucei spp.-specific protein n=1 Tax=Trypanosoma brucei gambiense (strain MHOM/CI/86/DAL972) TaxID=679716 RepID=C9ZJ85_TRYB9|nr:T. brucei spp.-specific protein [Trypanosoma brucei gambiense DAL972]CBH09444.1 T. brucei spp.-specific protein [Trypanosoma brucei gambiense DAL972]|eukprot:XP_011771749.1 T. brucei spp.-specific protein [Trypanosoma brucei gambiense DAL972]
MWSRLLGHGVFVLPGDMAPFFVRLHLDSYFTLCFRFSCNAKARGHYVRCRRGWVAGHIRVHMTGAVPLSLERPTRLASSQKSVALGRSPEFAREGNAVQFLHRDEAGCLRSLCWLTDVGVQSRPSRGEVFRAALTSLDREILPLVRAPKCNAVETSGKQIVTT